VKLKTGAAVVAAAAAFTVVLAACSTNGTSPAPQTGNGQKSATGFNAATDGKVYQPSTKKGGTLKLVINGDADSYDGARFYYAWMFNFSRFYLRTLVTEDDNAGQASLKVVPDLAASQDISADGLTYTYKLKAGLKYEDGSPITTKDIKYGIERQFAQDILPGGPTYLIGALDEGQHYKGPYKDTDPNKLGLNSVQTPDDNTIIFKLASPDASFAYKLAMGAGAPVPPAKDTGAKYTNHPVSSGPYKFDTYEPGKSLHLVRNTNWDPSTDTVRRALPDDITLTMLSDDDQIDAGLLDSTYDVNVAQTGVQPTAQAKILTQPDLKANADDFSTGFIRYIAISSKVPPLDNIDCRKAVQYATDKVALQTARGGPFAGGDIAFDIIPPTLSGHDNSLNNEYTGKSGKPDTDKAKAALQSCGQPNGFKTVIATQSTSKGKAVAEALQQALGKVGIQATIDATDPSTYYSGTIGTPANVHKKDYGLMVAGWGADFPTNPGYLQVLVDSRLILQDGGNVNTGELSDPQIDSLIDQANKETDLNKSTQLWKQINKLTMDSATYMPFVYDKALNYRNPRLTNVFVANWVGMYSFTALGVVK
jgi:peptide/nickel transport system substrate-binding protein